VFTGSWSAPGLDTSWTGSWRAVGQRGTAVWDGNATIKVEAARGQRAEAAAVEPDPVSGRFQGLVWALEEFVIALRTGRPPQGECHDNALSLAMVTSALESAVRRERVAVLV
jgi:predicted dehydrogenase